MPRLDVEQGQPEWFAARLGRITASHAAGCLRRNPHEGPLAAFRAIMGVTERQANEYMEYGMRHEEEARYAYFLFAGKPQLAPGGFWVHPQYAWLGASPDALVGSDGGVELKCPQTNLPVAIPEAHEIQMRVQMAVCERDWWDYFAWWEPNQHYYERLHRDRAEEAALIDGLAYFYDTYIVPGTPPPRRARKEKDHDVRSVPQDD